MQFNCAGIASYLVGVGELVLVPHLARSGLPLQLHGSVGHGEGVGGAEGVKVDADLEGNRTKEASDESIGTLTQPDKNVVWHLCLHGGLLNFWH